MGRPARVIPDLTPEEQERFWSNVNQDSGCWKWLGHTFAGGYGSFHLRGDNYLAHRVALLLVTGVQPGEVGRHLCHRRNCVRVGDGHVTTGTYADNARDTAEAGRGRWPSGAQHYRTKITSADVEEMRRLRAAGETLRQVAQRYGINHTYCCALVRGLRLVRS